MNLDEIKYKNGENEYTILEDWMKFSIELANFMKKSKKKLSIYISVPSNLLFSYFYVLGSVNFDFDNISNEVLLEEYLNLKKGQRILYKVGEEWISFSVIKVTKMPINDKRAIVIKDRSNSKTYIPEERWIKYVRIQNNEIFELKRMRKFNEVKNISENIKLKNIYGKENLQLAMIRNTPNTYLFTNKKEWKNNLNILEFNINQEHLYLSDLLFDGTTHDFKNMSFIERNQNINLPTESVIIFIGSSRTIKKMDEFMGNKRIFIINQHDSIEKIEELKFKIEQDFLMGNSKIYNKEIIKYMKDNKILIPKGVELFAWFSCKK